MSRKAVPGPQAFQKGDAALQSKLRDAGAAFSQRRLLEAERIFEDILRRRPNHCDALHGLGVIAAQTGRFEDAIQRFRKALKTDARNASIYRNLGLALKDLNRLEEALSSFDKAIALRPDYAESYNSRGLTLHDLKRPADALVAYERAMELKSYFPEAHYNRGLALHDLGRLREAQAAYDKAIELKPIFPEAYYNRGITLERMNRWADALASYDRAIALKPDFAEAHSNRGNVLQEQRHLEEALASHDRALALKPNFAEGHNNRSLALMFLMRPTEALASCDTAIALEPNFAQAYNNRGNILQDLGRHAEALAAYDMAVTLRPDYIEALSNKSHHLLLLGRLSEGWRLHEARKELPNPIAVGSYDQPLWLGEQDIACKRLLIWWEQGFGDTIQFCRYAKLLEARGAKVLMSVQEPLRELLSQISPTIEMVDANATPDFDYHCPLMSLPLALGTTLESIPAEPFYLRADEKLRDAWEARLPRKTKPRIGVVWSGSTEHKIFNRSMALRTFIDLLDADADWICMQKEIDAADAALLQKDGRIAFFGADFSNTAALMALTDLVITIDTSLAHLAGALGKPVWILLPFNANWRWLRDRNDSPWYPSARLFRQHEIDNWMVVIEAVRREIKRVFWGQVRAPE